MAGLFENPLWSVAPESEPEPSSAPVDEPKTGRLFESDLWTVAEPASEPALERHPLQATGAGTATGAMEGGASFAGAATGFKLGLMTGPFAPVGAPVGAAAGFMLGQWVGSSAGASLKQAGDEKSPSYQAGYTLGSTAAGIVSLPYAARAALGHLPDTWAGRLVQDMLRRSAQGVFARTALPKAVAERLPVESIPHFSRYALEESVGALGASAGAFWATDTHPENPIVRGAAEVFGGAAFSAGTGWVASGGGLVTLWSKALPWLAKQTPGGRRAQVSDVIRAYLDASGEDPNTFVRLLHEGEAIRDIISDTEHLPGTASMLFDSPALAALEKSLGKEAVSYMNVLTKAQREALQAYGNSIALLRGEGSSEALELAVVMRSQMQEQIIEGALQDAKDKAYEAAQRIAGADLLDVNGKLQPGVLERMSREASEIISDRMEQLRTTEDHLWKVALQGKEDKVNLRRHTLEAFDFVSQNLVPDEIALPMHLRHRMQDLAGARRTLEDAENPDIRISERALAKALDTLSVKRLLLMRSTLLQQIRSEAAAGNDMQAGILGRIVDGLTEDLYEAGATSKTQTLSLPGGGERHVRRLTTGKFSKATPLDQAMQFTKSMKDVSARTFIGSLRQKDQEGASILAPELLLRRALASGNELASVRVRQIQDFLEFPANKMGVAIDEGALPPSRVNDYLTAQNNMLRSLAYAAVDDKGKVSVARLRTFMSKHGSVLEDFPEVRRDVEAAMSSQRDLEDLLSKSRIETRVKKQSLDWALGHSSAQGALKAALSYKKNPTERLNTLVQSAREAGPEAMESLRYSMWSLILERSKGEGLIAIDPEIVQRTLASPIAPGTPTLREYMIANDLLPADKMERLDRVLAYTKRILDARETLPPDLEELLPSKGGMLETLFTSIGGAELSKKGLQLFGRLTSGGSSTHQVASGATLIAAARGSAALREWLMGVPHRYKVRILQDALAGAPIRADAEPFSLLHVLLEDNPMSAGKTLESLQKVNMYMWSAGMHAMPEYDSTEDDATLAP